MSPTAPVTSAAAARPRRTMPDAILLRHATARTKGLQYSHASLAPEGIAPEGELPQGCEHGQAGGQRRAPCPADVVVVQDLCLGLRV